MLTLYNRFGRLLQAWAILGVVLTFVWPLGAVVYQYTQAMVEECIPSAIHRLWEFWGLLQMLWELFH